MKSVLSRITAVAIGLACALVLVETALRLLYPAYTHFYVWPPGTSMVFRPLPSLIAGVSSPSHFNINAHGIDGRDAPEELRGPGRLGRQRRQVGHEQPGPRGARQVPAT